jgi:hypothetical protein
MAEKVLNLIPSDVGRPIQQVKQLRSAELEHLLETIDSLATKERVVTTAAVAATFKIQPTGHRQSRRQAVLNLDT